MSYFWHFLCPFFLLSAMATAAPLGQDVDPADPEVQACVAFGIKSFNFHSQTHQLHNITKFHSVHREEVGAGQYDIDVEVRGCQSSFCSPDNSNTQIFRCHFVIVTAPWKKQLILINSTCTPVS
ncbi:uncharacterized protein LOC118370152 [Oncorhynchus keta]|uniref:uncharacterized protein LOC118370152 n=1 Tax=Oncorhynchus keta TaxID=8018 RepID=UPI0015F7AB79|nr:uncharacterized protein LOC118370152 [Oncorhynchus keta]